MGTSRRNADKVVWIGLNKTPIHDKVDVIDIPNYYEFQHNLDCNESNVVDRKDVKQGSHLTS